eukprot:TRINITY_DN12721_c0_g1_i1.p1 TRINITY_DN12721_c0_g1~~TRINITY_DN12721_c0_g1_i1.p1  ORF type:complete len:1243 (-),score=263.37 TRINITY_DN12721_c0_g1_i1:63-3791(-)
MEADLSSDTHGQGGLTEYLETLEDRISVLEEAVQHLAQHTETTPSTGKAAESELVARLVTATSKLNKRLKKLETEMPAERERTRQWLDTRLSEAVRAESSGYFSNKMELVSSIHRLCNESRIGLLDRDDVMAAVQAATEKVRVVEEHCLGMASEVRALDGVRQELTRGTYKQEERYTQLLERLTQMEKQSRDALAQTRASWDAELKRLRAEQQEHSDAQLGGVVRAVQLLQGRTEKTEGDLRQSAEALRSDFVKVTLGLKQEMSNLRQGEKYSQLLEKILKSEEATRDLIRSEVQRDRKETHEIVEKQMSVLRHDMKVLQTKHVSLEATLSQATDTLKQEFFQDMHLLRRDEQQLLDRLLRIEEEAKAFARDEVQRTRREISEQLSSMQQHQRGASGGLTAGAEAALKHHLEQAQQELRQEAVSRDLRQEERYAQLLERVMNAEQVGRDAMLTAETCKTELVKSSGNSGKAHRKGAANDNDSPAKIRQELAEARHSLEQEIAALKVERSLTPSNQVGQVPVLSVATLDAELREILKGYTEAHLQQSQEQRYAQVLERIIALEENYRVAMRSECQQLQEWVERQLREFQPIGCVRSPRDHARTPTAASAAAAASGKWRDKGRLHTSTDVPSTKLEREMQRQREQLQQVQDQLGREKELKVARGRQFQEDLSRLAGQVAGLLDRVARVESGSSRQEPLSPAPVAALFRDGMGSAQIQRVEQDIAAAQQRIATLATESSTVRRAVRQLQKQFHAIGEDVREVDRKVVHLGSACVTRDEYNALRADDARVIQLKIDEARTEAAARSSALEREVFDVAASASSLGGRVEEAVAAAAAALAAAAQPKPPAPTPTHSTLQLTEAHERLRSASPNVGAAAPEKRAQKKPTEKKAPAQAAREITPVQSPPSPSLEDPPVVPPPKSPPRAVPAKAAPPKSEATPKPRAPPPPPPAPSMQPDAAPPAPKPPSATPSDNTGKPQAARRPSVASSDGTDGLLDEADEVLESDLDDSELLNAPKAKPAGLAQEKPYVAPGSSESEEGEPRSVHEEEQLPPLEAQFSALLGSCTFVAAQHRSGDVSWMLRGPGNTWCMRSPWGNTDGATASVPLRAVIFGQPQDAVVGVYGLESGAAEAKGKADRAEGYAAALRKLRDAKTERVVVEFVDFTRSAKRSTQNGYWDCATDKGQSSRLSDLEAYAHCLAVNGGDCCAVLCKRDGAKQETVWQLAMDDEEDEPELAGGESAQDDEDYDEF